MLISDTDFLSSFIKIGKVELVRDFYQVERIYITPGVYHELAQANLDRWLDGIDWVEEKRASRTACEHLQAKYESVSLGIGETEAIVLCKSIPDSLLLISDNKARRIAEREEVACVDIPGFLLACKITAFLTRNEISEIIVQLKERDHYGFNDAVRRTLLTVIQGR